MARADVDNPGHQARRAFTLVELLVVIAIVAILASLLLPAAAGTLKAARSFRCQSSLRSVAFDFSVFADDTLHGNRGNDESDLTGDKFRLATFQDSQYGLNEFWRWDQAEQMTITPGQPGDPLRCAEMRGEVTLLSATPCTGGGVNPPENISYTFNMRLHTPERRLASGAIILSPPVALTSAILDTANANVPLVWDVDGAAASAADTSPVFGAPSLNSTGPMGSDRFWFPGLRHAGSLNAAFLDGHVASSSKPLAEQWNWVFQPKR